MFQVLGARVCRDSEVHEQNLMIIGNYIVKIREGGL
jgi:hypothetical protein